MDQRSAKDEISRSIDEAAVDTRDVTQAIRAVSSAVCSAVLETGDAAQRMLGVADELSRIVQLLRSEVNRFFVVIRTV